MSNQQRNTTLLPLDAFQNKSGSNYPTVKQVSVIKRQINHYSLIGLCQPINYVVNKYTIQFTINIFLSSVPQTKYMQMLASWLTWT